MLEDIEKLINFIIFEHEKYTKRWIKSDYYVKLNLKKTLIKDLISNEKYMSIIFDYRKFLNEYNIELMNVFQRFNNKSAKVDTRVKAINSIEYKVKNYYENHNSGESPIIKCYNDLFGIRIIIKNEISYTEIEEFINKKYNKQVRVIKAVRNEYQAVHVYFKVDNYSFPWELQIWNEKDEMINKISHEKYKQDYAKWEKQNKGGDKI